MNHFQALRIQIRAYLIFVILVENLLIIVGLWFVLGHFDVSLGFAALGAYAVSVVMTFIITFAATDYALQPLKAVWLTILHILPGDHRVAAPNISKLPVGRTLVASLSAQIYQIASIAEQYDSEEQKTAKMEKTRSNLIANALPLPLLVLDKESNVIFANESCLRYLEQTAPEVVGKDVYSVLDMSFSSDDTFDTWLRKAKTSTVTATKTWERVRLNRPGNPLQFDLAAYYNKDNPSGVETVLVLFDHTETYAQDDQAMSFVALAVHELRTPLTLLRGYIELFDDELGDKLDDELKDFMFKMNAAAQQLSAFVNNILNVARIEGDQLFLRLREDNWSETVQAAVRSWALRAHVRGIKIECQVAPGLPTVGVDRVSIYEVISNLIDNAIKYSGNGKKIVIKSALTKDGLVETTVQDFGVGIPESVMPNLFSKFYRNYRNRAQIGGTGLGLYLAKTIVTAHGGNIWVRSKEGEGTTFGFTVMPYAKLADEQKNGDNKDITTSAHGWIKNHSLYRR
ncbi:MAG TPA: ATP-binding protein [Candidatus Saccharimonadales bacterium]|jgi:signal transduction histidine kinase